jgi:MFS family permease
VKRTNVRHAIVTATTLAAFLMYLDRLSIAWVLDSDSFKYDFTLTEGQRTLIVSSFFWAYALAQVPAGWLAERFGKRTLMALMILAWSAFTALFSFADGILLLVVARVGIGLAQAGAYPISSSLLARWAHPQFRAMASSIVSLGGRMGLVLAPIITAYVIAGSNWRWAGWIYGLAGILVALIFWSVFRETPEEHPRCNEAEQKYLLEGRPPPKPQPVRGFPFMAIVTDSSVWLMCAQQFLTNVGWAFVPNLMSSYFKKVHGVDDQFNGAISTFALVIGITGLLLGGVFTDACTRKLGIRYGRMVPLAATRFLAAACLAACLFVGNIYLLAVLIGMMVFFCDAGIPAMWAWAQDVGGRQIAPIMGWANMWGNFGAAAMLYIVASLTYRLNLGPEGGFAVCAGAFALAGVLSLGINAERPVVMERS